MSHNQKNELVYDDIKLLPEWDICGIFRHQQIVGFLWHHVEIHDLQNISHVQSAGTYSTWIRPP